jgi:hypothetical protein
MKNISNIEKAKQANLKTPPNTQYNRLSTPEGITRKEAIKRMGKYAAVTALGAYIILNPMKAQASSAGFPLEGTGGGIGGNGGITPMD